MIIKTPTKTQTLTEPTKGCNENANSRKRVQCFMNKNNKKTMESDAVLGLDGLVVWLWWVSVSLPFSLLLRDYRSWRDKWELDFCLLCNFLWWPKSFGYSVSTPLNFDRSSIWHPV
jgi:hypothetical protein